MIKGIVRPDVEVLPESTLIPAKNQIAPPPNQFTHELTKSVDYYFDENSTDEPRGRFEVGTKLLLLAMDGDQCWVANSEGLYVRISCGSLAKLSPKL
jgi:hypothetical protein